MTPEQKELKATALRARFENPAIPVEMGTTGYMDRWLKREPSPEHWVDPKCLIRLAPPAEIPYYNPDQLTEEQLEPQDGWRFALEGETITDWQYWVKRTGGKSEWSPLVGGSTSTVTVGTGISSSTRRIKKPLPAKYQHLVPESEEARARRLLTDLKAPEGYGELEFLGSGPVDIEDGFMYANMVKDSSRPTWKWQYGLNGKSAGCFYARARKIPTDQEKAEAALNAYKLEPGERLVHRGKGWYHYQADYLYYNPDTEEVTRVNNNYATKQHGHYAEIFKEPEMVPFTQETFPLGAWVRVAGKEKHCRHLVLQVACDGVVLDGIGVLNYASLLERWEICTDGTTWTRAGKGVGA